MKRIKHAKPKRRYLKPAGRATKRGRSRRRGFPSITLNRKAKFWLGTTLFILVLVYVFLLRPFVVVYSSGRGFKKGAHSIAQNLKEQDFEGIDKDLDKMEKDLKKLDSVAQQYQYLSFIPYASTFINDSEHFTQAGLHGLNMMRVMFETLEPYKESLGFTDSDREDNFGGEVNKMVAAVRVAPKVLPGFDRIAEEFHLMRLELDQVDRQKYPETIKGKEIRSNLQFAVETVAKFDDSMPAVKSFLTKLPDFMGDAGTKEKTYLILFQNNKELRASGGFLTSYALLTLKDGEVAEVISGDTYELDERIGYITDPHPVLQKFLLTDHWFARDANFSPDYVASAEKFYEFWQMTPNPKIDGIFAMDTDVPAELLKVLGPVTIIGYEKEFDHENIVEELSNQARELREQAGRKALVGLLMTSIEGKIFDAPQEQWVPLFSAFYNLLYEKHLLLYAFDPEVQEFFDAFNFSGKVREFDGDYLYVNDTNLGGGKANFYMEQFVTKEIEEKDGKLFSTLTVRYRNKGEYDQEVNPGYQDYVRVLVPLGSKLVSSWGSQEPVQEAEELGKTEFIAVNITPPMEESELKFVYELPATVSYGDYKVLIQKQPGKPNDRYTIKKGKRIEEIILKSDKEVGL